MKRTRTGIAKQRAIRRNAAIRNTLGLNTDNACVVTDNPYNRFQELSKTKNKPER